jgi:hypothetical protein
MIVKRQVLRIVGIAAIAAGGVLPLASPAQADTGLQLSTVVQVSVSVSGNAVSIGGVAAANGQTSSKSPTAQGRTWSSFAKLFGTTWS